MDKTKKHRFRVVYEKLESAFDDPTPEVTNTYYEGLVNLEIHLDPKILNKINLTDWGNEGDIEQWKNALDKQGQVIKKVIEAQLNINEEKIFIITMVIMYILIYVNFVTIELN